MSNLGKEDQVQKQQSEKGILNFNVSGKMTYLNTYPLALIIQTLRTKEVKKANKTPVNNPTAV